MDDPLEVLLEGSEVLRPVLEQAGYVFEEPTTGKSSGGPLAVGRWRRGDSSIETHVRTSLGMVEYRHGELTLSHADYMRVQGIKGAYPGFSTHPVVAFSHLAEDLAGPANTLLTVSRDEFAELSSAAQRLPRRVLP